MNLQQLKYFVAAAESLSFSYAALRENITQPAISKQIKELENEYGCQLFVRDTHKVALTEAGKEFLKYAREVIASDRDIRNTMQIFNRGNLGKVSVAFLGAMRNELSATLSRFCAEYPQVQVQADQMPGAGIYDALRDHTHDFYFATKWSLSFTQNYSFQSLNHSGLVLIYPKKWKDEIRPDQLSALTSKPFAYFPRKQGIFLFDHTMNVLSRRGYSPGIMNYFDSAEACVLAVEAGVCLTVLPEHMFRENELRNVCIRKIPGDDTLVENIIAWKPAALSLPAKHFLNIVKNLCKEQKYQRTPSDEGSV